MPLTSALLERKFMAQVRISFFITFSVLPCCLSLVKICFFKPNYSFESVSPGGSFRHFLWQVCKELQSSALSLLLPCPSAAANRNKVRLISEEKFSVCPVLDTFVLTNTANNS